MVHFKRAYNFMVFDNNKLKLEIKTFDRLTMFFSVP